jgi:hypothetical protein
MEGPVEAVRQRLQGKEKAALIIVGAASLCCQNHYINSRLLSRMRKWMQIDKENRHELSVPSIPR